MFSLKVLGALTLDSNNGPVPPAARQKRRLGLLAILAIAGPRGASRERVQAYLWPESSGARARHALDQALYATRHALGAEPFVSVGGDIGLAADVVRSDVGAFEAAVARGAFAEAVAIYGGPLLDGVHLSSGGELDRWIETARAKLEIDYRNALEQLARSAAAESDWVSAIAWWRRLASSDPLSSRVTIETIRALVAAGEHAAAVQCARTFQRLVRAELDVEPDSAIEALVAGFATPVAENVETAASRERRPSSRLTSVAVVPFVFLGEAEGDRALSLGFADALITIFGNLDDLIVAPTSAILHYAAGVAPEVACRELGVGHALQGTVQRIGSRWRVSIQLFEAAAHRIILSERHDFTLDDMFEVQDEIGRRVIASLHRRFPAAAPTSRARYSQDREAYGEYMSGLSESASGRDESLRSAAAHLVRAVERDPQFALAHATLSMVAMDMHFHFDPQRTWLHVAEEHNRRALALDPSLAEGHLARAWILWSPARGFQHADAVAALEQVLAARPHHERAHNRMSSICGHIGRLPEARLAHERAGRANPRTRTGNLEWNHLYAGDFARAEVAVEDWFRECPDSLYARYTRILPPLLSGDLALAEHRLNAALLQQPGEPLLVSLQGILHARRGERASALECVRGALASPKSFGHTHHTHYQVASVYALLGDSANAMAWLDRTVDGGFACWPFFGRDPHLASLRDEPVFTRLVADLESTYGGLEIARV